MKKKLVEETHAHTHYVFFFFFFFPSSPELVPTIGTIDEWTWSQRGNWVVDGLDVQLSHFVLPLFSSPCRNSGIQTQTSASQVFRRCLLSAIMFSCRMNIRS